MRFFSEAIKGLYLSGFVGMTLIHLAAFGDKPATPNLGILSGTVIGNAKFVEYSNEIYGFKLMYPEQWNLVDSGQFVNIVAYQPEGDRLSSFGDQRLPESIDLHFEDRYTFESFGSFERYVRTQDSKKIWYPVTFKGLPGLKYQGFKDAAIVVLRPDQTALRLSFPMDSQGVPVLVEKTIDSISFR